MQGEQLALHHRQSARHKFAATAIHTHDVDRAHLLAASTSWPPFAATLKRNARCVDLSAAPSRPYPSALP